MRILRRYGFAISLLLTFYRSDAQTIAVRSDIMEEFYRREQLAGNLDSTISFAVRPLHTYSMLFDSVGLPIRLPSGNVSSSKFDRPQISILPASVIQQYAGHPLHQWNDGPMISAKGYQALATAGVFAKYGPFSIQLQPEFVFAGNASFPAPRLHYGSADIPARFGDQTYSKLYWGQSSFRITFSPVSIGISNENLWWGPGNRNSLLMSNNAPGFKHLTLNTTKPVRTPIGNWEGQIIAARLDGSTINQSLPKDWRYLSGLVLSYNPKWTPGLFLGLTRSFQMYQKDMNGKFGDIFPFFQAFQKKNTNEDATPRDQLTSLFARWLVPSAQAEIYFEYGLNDHSYNTRDFLMSPEHSRAYILGMRKLIPYKGRTEEHIQLSAEITHLEQAVDALVRDAGEWYMHSQIVHGYTHRGQVLGAGVGPSANHQSFEMSWVSGLRKVGVQLERFEHNAYLARAFRTSPWIDISMAAVGSWNYKNLLFNAKLQGINSINYLWQDGINGRAKKNGFFLNGQIGLMYFFNKNLYEK